VDLPAKIFRPSNKFAIMKIDQGYWFLGFNLPTSEVKMEFDLTTRLTLLVGFFMFFACLEHFHPHRFRVLSRKKRWSGNISLFLFDVVVVGLPFNGLIFAVLWWVQQDQIGLMNALPMPAAAQVVVGVLALDALMYFQHRLSHVQPLLWRLHRVHHADTEMDVTTANRVHPLESLWIAFLRVSLAVILGIPVLAVVVYLVALNIFSLFNHVNLHLPHMFDRVLRWIIVTPAMHETHHSAHVQDFDRNFSFVFSIWDRIFKSYKPYTHQEMGQIELGLEEFRGSDEARLFKLLTMPFRNDVPKSS
jgi:sterol desaturase/sphingolipid hydroxylase (fatty acid hydroxylase superfamily)